MTYGRTPLNTATTTAPHAADNGEEPNPAPPGLVSARWRKLLAAAVGASACLTLVGGLGFLAVPKPSQPPSSRQSSESLHSIATPHASEESSPASPAGTDVAHERACGSIAMIDKLTNATLDPTPDPGGPKPRPINGHALIGLGNALNNVDRRGMPATLSAAITAHAYRLANLGAMINHHADTDDIKSAARADPDDIKSTADVVRMTAALLLEFCGE